MSASGEQKKNKSQMTAEERAAFALGTSRAVVPIVIEDDEEAHTAAHGDGTAIENGKQDKTIVKTPPGKKDAPKSKGSAAKPGKNQPAPPPPTKQPASPPTPPPQPPPAAERPRRAAKHTPEFSIDDIPDFRKLNMLYKAANEPETLAKLQIIEQHLSNKRHKQSLKGQLGVTLVLKMGIDVLYDLLIEDEELFFELARDISRFQ